MHNSVGHDLCLEPAYLKIFFLFVFFKIIDIKHVHVHVHIKL